MKSFKLYQGDCQQILKKFRDNTFDALVTDPPAGISFMGKEWDGNKGGREEWIAWLTEVMREAYRVMKPGAHGLVWALPRTSHWTATALENAGFEVRDRVQHLFGSGFPKSLDVSKAIDKAAGAERTEVLHERHDADKLRYLQKEGGYESPSGWKVAEYNLNVMAPATEAAKQWAGWGTALKPACEDWWLIRKPLSEKTVAANVLKWGTGALNIDGTRIALNGEKNPSIARYNSTPQKGSNGWEHANRGGNFNAATEASMATGRFPSHLILDEEAAAMLDAQSGISKSTGGKKGGKLGGNGTYGTFENMERANAGGLGDTGGASRFFYVAKASKSDKNAGLEGMPTETVNTYAGDTKRKLVHSRTQDRMPIANIHPTVKSTTLMRYLCRLITPPGGIVLDPFMGSGSTGVAALGESFRFVGAEQNPEYLAIAQARIEAATTTTAEGKDDDESEVA